MKQKNYIGAKTAHGSLKREGTRKVITMILVNDVRCLLTSVNGLKWLILESIKTITSIYICIMA